MAPPIYATRLRLRVEVANNQTIDDVVQWQDLADIAPFRQGVASSIRTIASRELTHVSLVDGPAPSVDEAERLLTTIMADQPSTTNDWLEGVSADPSAAAADVAYVMADIVLVPTKTELSPGEEIPIVGQTIGRPRLAIGTPWRHKATFADEREAAGILLEKFVSALPRESWRDIG